ncbi:unnamed protein product, partial [Amoebophrya sp. A120]|eukprot:GSA120T00020042001.1
MSDHHTMVSSVPQPPAPDPGMPRDEVFLSKWYTWNNDVFDKWYAQWHERLKEKHPWITSRLQLTGQAEVDNRPQILTDTGFSDVDWTEDNDTWRFLIGGLCFLNLVACVILAISRMCSRGSSRTRKQEKDAATVEAGDAEAAIKTGAGATATIMEKMDSIDVLVDPKSTADIKNKPSPPSTALPSRQNSKSLDNYELSEVLEAGERREPQDDLPIDEAVVPIDDEESSVFTGPSTHSQALPVVWEISMNNSAGAGATTSQAQQKINAPPRQIEINTEGQHNLSMAPEVSKTCCKGIDAQIYGVLSAAITVFLVDGFPFIPKPGNKDEMSANKAKNKKYQFVAGADRALALLKDKMHITSQASAAPSGSSTSRSSWKVRFFQAVLSNTFGLGFGLAAMYGMFRHIQTKLPETRVYLHNREWVIVFLLAPLFQTVAFFAAWRVLKLFFASSNMKKLVYCLAVVCDHGWRGGARVFRGMLLGLTVYFGGYFL